MKEMTREQLIEAARKYNMINNEGGQGYNPYHDEIERREMEEAKAEAAKPMTKQQQIEALQDKIRVECGSVAREWDADEVDRKEAAYYAEIKILEDSS
jgi:hypothetical protein